MGLVLERLDSIDRHLVELIGMKAEQMRQEYGDGGRESGDGVSGGQFRAVVNAESSTAAANPATPPLEINTVEARYICLACMNPEGYRAWHFEKGSNHRKGERVA